MYCLCDSLLSKIAKTSIKSTSFLDNRVIQKVS
jgi:hypothetical protein